jgi:hypothetical protein
MAAICGAASYAGNITTACLSVWETTPIFLLLNTEVVTVYKIADTVVDGKIRSAVYVFENYWSALADDFRTFLLNSDRRECPFQQLTT